TSAIRAAYLKPVSDRIDPGRFANGNWFRLQNNAGPLRSGAPPHLPDATRHTEPAPHRESRRPNAAVRQHVNTGHLRNNMTMDCAYERGKNMSGFGTIRRKAQ